MPSGRYPYPRPCTESLCYLCHEVSRRRQQTRGYLVAAFSSRHIGTPFKDVPFANCSFGYCLILWADRLPPKDGSESAPFRPIPDLQEGCLSLKHQRRKLGAGSQNSGVFPTGRLHPLPVRRSVLTQRVGTLASRRKEEVFALNIYSIVQFVTKN